VSYELIIATRMPPTRAMVESHLRGSGWRLALEGDLAGDAGNLSAESRGLFRRKPMFILSGPYAAEREDLPVPLQKLIRGPAFQLEMSIPSSVDDKDAARALALCEDIARTGDGAVYDPQSDEVLFPDVPRKPPAREPVLTPIRQLTLEWYLAANQPIDGARFLEAARRIWPEALPTRYGPTEPMRFKMADPAGEAGFLERWQPDASFFWISKKPMFGGHLFWSATGPEPPGKRARVVLSQSLNATAIESDQAMCDRAADLFVAVADDLRAFFGAGYVTRGVLVGSRGGQRYGPGTENFSNDWITGPWWLGLPAKPTWLAWFGEPYRDLVASSLGGLAVPREHGLVVRLGPAPMDTDELRGHAPDLPSDLLMEIRTTVVGPKKNLFIDERIPATHIPPLG
jgi:hypothetical protein